MDPKEVNTSHVLRKVREIKSKRKIIKQNRQNFIDDITDVQQRLTNLDLHPETFDLDINAMNTYRAFLLQQEDRLNRGIMEFDDNIVNYNARIRRAQFYAPFDDISLDSD